MSQIERSRLNFGSRSAMEAIISLGISVTLKQFLTKQTWGGRTLFKNLSLAARFMIENCDQSYSNATSLASLLGQVSQGLKPPSRGLLTTLQNAVMLATEDWDFYDRTQCFEDFSKVSKALTHDTDRLRGEGSVAQTIFEESLSFAEHIVLIIGDRDVAPFGMRPFDMILDRLYADLELGNNFDVNTTSIPKLSILVRSGMGRVTQSSTGDIWWRSDLSEFSEEMNARLNHLESLGMFNVFEVSDVVCWSSAVLFILPNGSPKAFHYYYEFAGPIRLSDFQPELAWIMKRVIFTRLIDPEDHDLRKKRILRNSEK